MGLIIFFALIGGICGWLMAERLRRAPVETALIGALGGAAGGIGFWIVVGLLGLLAGALGAIAGAILLLSLYNRWRRG